MESLYVTAHVYVKKKMIDIPDRSRIIITWHDVIKNWRARGKTPMLSL